MNTFEVVLSKSYTVTIDALSENDAARFSEYFTSDSIDISSLNDRVEFNFSIKNIECQMNESFEVKEIGRENK